MQQRPARHRHADTGVAHRCKSQFHSHSPPPPPLSQQIFGDVQRMDNGKIKCSLTDGKENVGAVFTTQARFSCVGWGGGGGDVPVPRPAQRRRPYLLFALLLLFSIPLDCIN